MLSEMEYFQSEKQKDKGLKILAPKQMLQK